MLWKHSFSVGINLAFGVLSGFVFNSFREYQNLHTLYRWHILRFLIWLISSKWKGGLLIVSWTVSLLLAFSFIAMRLVFGKLRDVEAKNIRERTTQFLFFKLFFVLAVLDVRATEFPIWLIWFFTFCTLKLHVFLARDRLDYIVAFPSANMKDLVRLFCFLPLLLITGALMCSIWVQTFWVAGYSVVFMLAFEFVSLLVSSMQVILRIAPFLWEAVRGRRGGGGSSDTISYQVDFFGSILLLSLTLVHYLHIIYLNGFGLSLAHVFMPLYVKNIFSQLRQRIRQDQVFRKLKKELERRYPPPTAEELSSDPPELCAICRDELSPLSPSLACKLECSHLFHVSCLRSWLAQDSSCPVCRAQLTVLDSQSSGSSPSSSSTTTTTTTMNPGVANVGERIRPGAAAPPHAPLHHHVVAAPGARLHISTNIHIPGFVSRILVDIFSFVFSFLPVRRVRVVHPNELHRQHNQQMQQQMQQQSIDIGSGNGSGNDRQMQHQHRPMEHTPAEDVVRNLLSMFPHLDASAVIQDLRETGNASVTVDHALSGRIRERMEQQQSFVDNGNFDVLEQEREEEREEEQESFSTTSPPSPPSSSSSSSSSFAAFGSTPLERRQQFLHRKQHLLASARKMIRSVNNHSSTAATTEAEESSGEDIVDAEQQQASSSSSSLSSLEQRRRIMLEAATRRLSSSSPG